MNGRPMNMKSGSLAWELPDFIILNINGPSS